MKISLVIIFFLNSFSTFCQNGQITGRITKSDTILEYKYLTVLLKHGDSTITGTIPDTNGLFKIKDIPEGFYSLIIQQIGYRETITDSLKITQNSTIDLSYPPPCRFVYLKLQVPKCIGGHTGHIIPIVYGLPTKKTMERAKRGLVHLGGCFVSDCDPRYYCTIHNKEL